MPLILLTNHYSLDLKCFYIQSLVFSALGEPQTEKNGAASEALNITIFFTFQKFQILKFSLKQITFSIKHLHQGPRKKNPPLIGQKAGRIELRNHHGTEEKIKFEQSDSKDHSGKSQHILTHIRVLKLSVQLFRFVFAEIVCLKFCLILFFSSFSHFCNDLIKIICTFEILVEIRTKRCNFR